MQSLHFNLSGFKGDKFMVRSSLKSYPIHQHTAGSLEKARAEYPVLRLIPDEKITHYIDNAPLPQNHVVLVEVHRHDDPAMAPLLYHIHIPEKGQKAWQQHVAENDGERIPEIHPKLTHLNISGQEFVDKAGTFYNYDVDPKFPPHINNYIDAFNTATALLFHHKKLLNLSKENGFLVPSYIINNCISPALNRHNSLVSYLDMVKDGWYSLVAVKDREGKPMKGADGKILYTRKIREEVSKIMLQPLSLAINLAQNATVTENQVWSIQQGITSSSYGAGDSTQPEAAAAESSYNWALKNLTPGFGLTIDPAVKYTPPSNTWSAKGLWSADDTEQPLTADLVSSLLKSELYIQVNDKSMPNGILRAQLVPAPYSADEPVNFYPKLEGSAVVPPVSTKANGTGFLTLNTTQTGITYSIMAYNLGPGATGGIYRGDPKTNGKLIRAFDISDFGSVEISCKNAYLRHLSAYAVYLDAAGNPLTPPSNLPYNMPAFLRKLLTTDPTIRYQELISPTDTISGIPLKPEPTSLVIPVWEEVQRVALRFGGLGQGPYDPYVCPVGSIMTTVVEIGIPVIELIAGDAIGNSEMLKNLLEDKQVLYSIIAVGAFALAGQTAADLAIDQHSRSALVSLADEIGPLLLQSGLKAFLEKAIAEGTAERAIPIVDLAFQLLSGAVTLAEIGQTTVEVLESPFVYKADITRTFNLNIQIDPSEKYHEFPPLATSYSVKVLYDSGATVPVYTGSIDTTRSEPIKVNFKNIPAGGFIQVLVFFHASNGWVAGQNQDHSWIPAMGTDGTDTLSLKVEIQINKIIPNKNTVYTHHQKLVYQDGRHQWQQAPAPTTTRSSKGIHKIQEWKSISLVQFSGMVAYSWMADLPNPKGGSDMLFTLQNISFLQDPQSAYALPDPDKGFLTPFGICYDIASPSDGSGRNFYIDPSRGNFDPVSNRAGGCHLRLAELIYDGSSLPPELPLGTDQSWGRFTIPMNRYALHPQGYVIGINIGYNKLFILKLPDAAMPDAEAPMPHHASGPAPVNAKARIGLLNGPVSVCIALDGRILVLEGYGKRIQAFDVNGNPVPYFKPPKNLVNEPDLIATLALESDMNLLDMSVDSRGYIYVLYYIGTGETASEYFLNIYEPDGTFLVQTKNFAASKIAISLLQTIFTLNYEALIGENGRTEPSISQWLPPAPNPGD